MGRTLAPRVHERLLHLALAASEGCHFAPSAKSEFQRLLDRVEAMMTDAGPGIPVPSPGAVMARAFGPLLPEHVLKPPSKPLPLRAQLEALDVLGDAVIESGFYDARVMRLLQTTHETNLFLTNTKHLFRQSFRSFATNDRVSICFGVGRHYVSPGDQGTRERLAWARALAAVLMFGDWSTKRWPIRALKESPWSLSLASIRVPPGASAICRSAELPGSFRGNRMVVPTWGVENFIITSIRNDKDPASEELPQAVPARLFSETGGNVVVRVHAPCGSRLEIGVQNTSGQEATFQVGFSGTLLS
jgi:hypothetical protein